MDLTIVKELAVRAWGFGKNIWDSLPEDFKDYSKSEVLNFMKKNAARLFDKCKGLMDRLWGTGNEAAREETNRATASFIDQDDALPYEDKKRIYEEMTGSEYRPVGNYNMEVLTPIVQTDAAKKAAAIQIAILISVFGKLTEKQEAMLSGYMNALQIAEKLKQEIFVEMDSVEREITAFARELSRLDAEFVETTKRTAKTKKEASDIIDLI